MFLVEGVNSSPEQVRKIGAIAERIRPDRIQLNTAVRPTAEPDVKALSEAALAELAKLLGPKAEVIADFRRPQEAPAFESRGAEVLDMIRRRPVTVADIAAGLGIPPEAAAARVRELLDRETHHARAQGRERVLSRDGPLASARFVVAPSGAIPYSLTGTLRAASSASKRQV